MPGRGSGCYIGRLRHTKYGYVADGRGTVPPSPHALRPYPYGRPSAILSILLHQIVAVPSPTPSLTSSPLPSLVETPTTQIPAAKNIPPPPLIVYRRGKKYVRAEILIASNIMRPNREDPTKTDFISVTHINPGGIADSTLGAKIVNKLCAKAPVNLLLALEKTANSPPVPKGTKRAA